MHLLRWEARMCKVLQYFGSAHGQGHGLPWAPTGSHGHIPLPMGTHFRANGAPWDVGTPWDLMGRCPWAMIPWALMGTYPWVPGQGHMGAHGQKPHERPMTISV